jgi:hypothetical protein
MTARADRFRLARLVDRDLVSCGSEGSGLSVADVNKCSCRRGFRITILRVRGRTVWGQDRLDMLEEAIVRFRKGDLGRSPGAKVAASA